ncbi:MAG: hypothetical protein R3B81_14110 [bacterium]
MRRRLALLALAATFGIGGAFGSRDLEATPLYAARSSRTCDNCHLTPNEWVDPVLAERKCTLSCQACHVDPAGGGMRNASGVFFGRATVPAIATSPRPTQDWDRNLPFVGRRDRATTYSSDLPLGPNRFEDVESFRDSANDRFGYGSPLGASSKYAFWPGRYGAVNADPAFAIGVDARIAFLSQGALVFPMQFDLPMRLHPVEHLTVFANTGARGRRSGYSDAFDDDHTPYFREAFVLLHEAPYQAYVKAGRFVPRFGLRLDDHTMRTRREFELDGALPESRVTGVEIGAAPNYPVLSFSWFRMASRTRGPDSWDVFDVDDGKGAAAHVGWRALGWSAGGSGLWRSRPLAEGGDTTTYALWGSWNPWFSHRDLPVTVQGELDWGRFQRASGRESTKLATYVEADWLAANGVNLLVAHDFADPDREVADDESHRVQAGMQITPYPGFTLDGRIRALIPLGAASEGSSADLFVQLHVWR